MTTTWHPVQRLHLVRSRPATRWSPFKVIAPVVGLLAVLAGLVTIGHSGFHAEHIFEPHDELAGLHYTPLLGACAVGFGLATLIGSAIVSIARRRIPLVSGLALGFGTALLTVAGAAALGLGVVVLADAWPSQLHHWLNVDHAVGVVCVIAGGAGIVAAITAPLTVDLGAVAMSEPAVHDDPPTPTEPREPADEPDPTVSTHEE